MPKHSPFFKFDSGGWLAGSIQFAPLEDQGIFMTLCALYWESFGELKIEHRLHLRLRLDEGTLKQRLTDLENLGVLSVHEGAITIKFLDEQIADRLSFLQKASDAGKKSAEKRRSVQGAVKVPSTKKKEERRDKKEEIRKDIKKDIVPNDSTNLPVPPSDRMKFGYKSDFKFTGIDKADIEEWGSIYPGVCFITEIPKAAQWLKANPAKRKKNIYAFLCRWFDKTQESGGSKQLTPTNGRSYHPKQSIPVGE